MSCNSQCYRQGGCLVCQAEASNEPAPQEAIDAMRVLQANDETCKKLVLDKVLDKAKKHPFFNAPRISALVSLLREVNDEN